VIASFIFLPTVSTSASISYVASSSHLNIVSDRNDVALASFAVPARASFAGKFFKLPVLYPSS
jgi:hypothetical protein